jgi:hypothetical protein
MFTLYKMNGANNRFNKSPKNIAKIFLLGFLALQGIRQLVQVNQAASSKTNPDGTPVKGTDGQLLPETESRAGQVAAWMTITMTLLAGYALYTPDTPQWTALAALFIATMGSGIALVYDFATNKTQAHAAEKNRMWFGILHIIMALAVLMYVVWQGTQTP